MGKREGVVCLSVDGSVVSIGDCSGIAEDKDEGIKDHVFDISGSHRVR